METIEQIAERAKTGQYKIDLRKGGYCSQASYEKAKREHSTALIALVHAAAQKVTVELLDEIKREWTHLAPSELLGAAVREAWTRNRMGREPSGGAINWFVS